MSEQTETRPRDPRTPHEPMAFTAREFFRGALAALAWYLTFAMVLHLLLGTAWAIAMFIAVPTAVIAWAAFLAPAAALGWSLRGAARPGVHMLAFAVFGAIVSLVAVFAGLRVSLGLGGPDHPISAIDAIIIVPETVAGALAVMLGWRGAAKRALPHLFLRPPRGQDEPMDEIVTLYDADGEPAGTAPRSRMRAENLRHGATACVVFRPDGRVFVHQRTESKDVYPGRWDFAAGGVMTAGETPDDAAARETAEELGVHTPLVPIGEGDYADAHTTYRGFLYWTVTTEEIVFQPEEVAAGMWMTRDELLDRLDSDGDVFMPDTVGLLGGWIREVDPWPPTGEGASAAV